ncbi:hypothetical protein LTR91_013509 [Friedmanniomyces endolithicus]|uniref:Autophagy-related protein 28 n=1 Tax=Friedmanniomyces endolithicus TaxID=329885 RepID=A0AAN6KDJ5_9PEZI|nr:hypothetical protein LTR94_013163 [Friedmanniomyces endolithicus]KAK0783787.1 hypothetical protein LTR59_011673 [Friedmanniomyces endolithicus]KAK0791134.1 hypothetical protein LTR38_010327 [Friedmanniomyces endolithicus]KAK0803253.1 hypothetical protein LTR75_008009 [Friedmanniomyces endolithicus]KAK0842402.1 hypothetical protein LTR03_009284 [Friedmanniomyces endolithicus]
MERSWFSKATASKYGLIADSSHELPRWRSPSPMAASIIPPPIVQSAYAGLPRASHKSVIVVPERSTPVDDRQSELEADLQFLLDAQAEGLVQGWEGGVPDDHTSTGSTTPTAQSVRSGSTRRKARVRKKPGLRSARKGIYNSILALSAVKETQLQEIDTGVHEKEDTLSRIDEWVQKRQGLEAASRHVNESEDAVRSQRLRQEANVLQEEISVVELQLSDMRARQRKLLRTAEIALQSVQAKLASYTSSMSLLEAEVQAFLATRPAESDEISRPQETHTSMWKLPAKQRTLDIAREQWTSDRNTILEQRSSIEQEKAALDAGAAVWKDVVTHVADFEKRMRVSMADLSKRPPFSDGNSERLRELLNNLDTVLEHLQTQHKFAEARDWRLLIAAIGAELEALRQGRQILQNVLGITNDSGGEPRSLVDAEEEDDGGELATGNGGDAIHELDRSFETARR